MGECFFWYRLTRVFPDKILSVVKWLCVCVCACMRECICPFAELKCMLTDVSGYYLATSADDSVVKLWDLRKLKNFKNIILEDKYEVVDVLCLNYILHKYWKNLLMGFQEKW